MKTLDEVIVALEVCTSGYCSHPKHGDCPYLDERNDCDTRQRKLDALHYLKEFQGLSKMWNDKLDKEQANPPLTWDELRTMEGEPVWIDSVPLVRRWVIIKKFHPIGGNKNLFDMEVEDGAHFLRKNMRRDDPAWWQAYRKERDESDR